MSVAQLLILFDHALLALLFLIALFCVVSAVMTSLYQGAVARPRRIEETEQEDAGVMERTDTCYSVKHGTAVLFESDLNNVVWSHE